MKRRRRDLPSSTKGNKTRKVSRAKVPESSDSGGDESDLNGSDELYPSSAYQALLGSLQAKGGSFAEAFARRQKEQQGVNSGEDEEENDDDSENKEASNSDEDASIIDETSNNEEDIDAANKANTNKIDVGNGHAYTKMRDCLKTGSPSHEKRGNEVAASDNEDTSLEASVSHGQSESEEHSDSEVASGSSLNAFKKHVDYSLTEKEGAMLSEGQAKFKCETCAANLESAKWITTASDFPMEEKELLRHGVKLRLRNRWLLLHRKPPWGDFQSHQQCQFFALCNSYRDVLHSRRPSVYAVGDQEDAHVTDAYLLHLLNHIFKTRDLVIKNNHKGTRTHSEEEIPRDQGFTRPKVLILLPLRSFALRVVKRMLELVPPSQKVNIEQHERFLEDFSVEDEPAEDEKEANKSGNSSKPADFNALFRGNNDDHFRIGIKFTRKSVKLYSDFYSSDIILASPLGLITRIGEAEHEKDKDVDFLSSIEILVIDYADIILMQNWSHIEEIGKQVNCIPAQQHGTDFMRIREWFLNGHGRYYRQTILLSAFADAGINAFFHRSCSNFAGKVKLKCQYRGVLSKIALQVRQVYDCVNCSSLTEADDARFQLFVKQLFPPLKESFQSGVMIFVSSYFDFVRLRNFLKAENMSFCLLGEYTKQSDVSRARAWFFHGKRQIILYTERAHFYHRYKIRGIKELIFYSLPEHAEFYAELTNMMEGLESPTSSIIFSRYDKLKLERIVGTSRAKRMLSSENRTFMLC